VCPPSPPPTPRWDTDGGVSPAGMPVASLNWMQSGQSSPRGECRANSVLHLSWCSCLYLCMVGRVRRHVTPAFANLSKEEMWTRTDDGFLLKKAYSLIKLSMHVSCPANDMCCVACGVWRVACALWRVACGVWRVACAL
jgi:hypothetical protein